MDISTIFLHKKMKWSRTNRLWMRLIQGRQNSPKNIDIESHFTTFWSESMGEKQEIHLIGWHNLSQSKKDGGLSFRGCFKSLLAKHGWLLLTSAESLAVRVYWLDIFVIILLLMWAWVEIHPLFSRVSFDGLAIPAWNFMDSWFWQHVHIF